MYKITSGHMTTYGGLQWKLGVKQTIEWPNAEVGLCNDYWFHYYETKLAARALNSIQGTFIERDCRLFKIEVGGLIRQGYGKTGCTELTLLEEVPFVPMGSMELMNITGVDSIPLHWVNNPQRIKRYIERKWDKYGPRFDMLEKANASI